MSFIPINLSGTLAADPQSKTLPSGRACASFRLAVNHWRLDKATGEYTSDTTSWFSVDCYGPLASNVSMSLHQGMSVVVQGTLKIREWSTDEKTGISPTVVAEHIGPDLRYGTANYQKASSANRHLSGQQQTVPGSESSWGGFEGQIGGPGSGMSGGSSLGDPSESEEEPAEGEPMDAGSNLGADAGSIPGADARTDEDEPGDDVPDTSDRDTVTAGAPF